MRKKTAFIRNILSHTLLYNSRTALKILNAINSHPHLLINRRSLFNLSGTLAQCHGATVTLQDRMDRYRSIPALPARTSQSHRMGGTLRPTQPLPWAGCSPADQAAQGPIQPSLGTSRDGWLGTRIEKSRVCVILTATEKFKFKKTPGLTKRHMEWTLLIYTYSVKTYNENLLWKKHTVQTARFTQTTSESVQLPLGNISPASSPKNPTFQCIIYASLPKGQEHQSAQTGSLFLLIIHTFHSPVWLLQTLSLYLVINRKTTCEVIEHKSKLLYNSDIQLQISDVGFIPSCPTRCTHTHKTLMLSPLL